jgi:methyl-accepting chemotaxis protein-2 (aspartate sensor receptor)
VGQDFSDAVALLGASIREMKVGKTGYYFVMRSDPAAAGQLAVHPSSESKNLIRPEGGGPGHAFAREMLERKQGMVEYV